MAEYTIAAGARTFRATVVRAGDAFRVTVDGSAHVVRLDRWLGTTHFRFSTGSARYPVVIRRQGEELLVAIAGEQHRLRVAPGLPVPRRAAVGAAPGVRQVTAPMPGLVVSVEVAPGDAIEAERPVAILEAMKMQSEIRAPVRGRVSAVHVKVGQEVTAGAVLATIEPE